MAAFASAGILAAGWQIGTSNGQAVPSTTTTTQGTTSASEPTTDPTTEPITEPTTDTTQPTTDTTTTASGTFTGTTATHRFGSVTVTVTLTDGEITALSEDVVSDGDHHSDRINDQAIPMIRSEVLAANSADVSTIGGATYTTDAYLTSLQSALDQAR